MKNADRLIRDKKRIEKTLSRLSDGVMLDLCRRAGTRADRDSTPGGPRAKGTVSDPTLSAVVRKMSAQKVADPIFDSVQDIARLLDEMSRMSMKLEDLVRFVTTGMERAKQATITECKICARIVECTPSDRLRSGMCSACYMAQRRAKVQ